MLASPLSKVCFDRDEHSQAIWFQPVREDGSLKTAKIFSKQDAGRIFKVLERETAWGRGGNRPTPRYYGDCVFYGNGKDEPPIPPLLADLNVEMAQHFSSNGSSFTKCSILRFPGKVQSPYFPDITTEYCVLLLGKRSPLFPVYLSEIQNSRELKTQKVELYAGDGLYIKQNCVEFDFRDLPGDRHITSIHVLFFN